MSDSTDRQTEADWLAAQTVAVACSGWPEDRSVAELRKHTTDQLAVSEAYDRLADMDILDADVRERALTLLLRASVRWQRDV